VSEHCRETVPLINCDQTILNFDYIGRKKTRWCTIICKKKNQSLVDQSPLLLQNIYFVFICLFSCFLHIFQILLLSPIIGWSHGLTHATHLVIAALRATYFNFLRGGHIAGRGTAVMIGGAQRENLLDALATMFSDSSRARTGTGGA
jgi:hypothetical protein